eukprot:s916_g3.t1
MTPRTPAPAIVSGGQRSEDPSRRGSLHRVFERWRSPTTPSTLKMRNVFETLGGEGLLCFFEESLDPAAAPHGNGSADVVATSAAWRQAHEVFADSAWSFV